MIVSHSQFQTIASTSCGWKRGLPNRSPLICMYITRYRPLPREMKNNLGLRQWVSETSTVITPTHNKHYSHGLYLMLMFQGKLWPMSLRQSSLLQTLPERHSSAAYNTHKKQCFRDIRALASTPNPSRFRHARQQGFRVKYNVVLIPPESLAHKNAVVRHQLLSRPRWTRDRMIHEAYRKSWKLCSSRSYICKLYAIPPARRCRCRYKLWW